MSSQNRPRVDQVEKRLVDGVIPTHTLGRLVAV
jgi:hypothetical protein